MSAIELVVAPRPRSLGSVSVNRVLPWRLRRSVGPFVFLDHMGPVEMPPGRGMDVPPHPHIGLATVTYLFEGEATHRDNLGIVQDIRPGDVNWMTAGRGVVHSERTPPELRAAGHRVHGLQAWVALPREAEEDAPSFSHHDKEQIPRVAIEGGELDVVLGSAYGATSPVGTASPTLYVEARLGGGVLAAPEGDHELAFYLVGGAVEIDGARFSDPALVVLRRGAPFRIAGRGHGVLLGGAPLDGPRLMWWNFVSSSAERIERAKADWREDRFPPIPGETERVPLPA